VIVTVAASGVTDKEIVIACRRCCLKMLAFGLMANACITTNCLRMWRFQCNHLLRAADVKVATEVLEQIILECDTGVVDE